MHHQLKLKLKLKRKVEVAVISDVHLGTEQSHSTELLAYLNSINPKKLILNGDIIDMRQYKKGDFPSSHLKVLNKITDLAATGTKVYYITGNRDELLRKFSDINLGGISIVDRLVLDLDDKKAWFLHGDLFNLSIKYAKWLAKLGTAGYDILILLNRMIKGVSERCGQGRYSLAGTGKTQVKNSEKHRRNIEKAVSNLAISKGYDYVINGHTHQPKIAMIRNKNGETLYLNSGNWIEHLTALEYQFKRWKLYHYQNDKHLPFYTGDQDRVNSDQLVAVISVIKSGLRID